MRFIKTFILRLYADRDAPERLCGDLNVLPDSKALSFRNQTELVALLLRAIHPAPEGGQVSQNLSGPDRSKSGENQNDPA